MNNERRNINDDINEKNLFFLGEEASQYIDEEGNRDMLQYNNQQDELVNLKYYCDDLSKKLMDKEGEVQNQAFQIQTMNLLVDNLKKNTKSLHEKLAETEKIKIHVGAQNKKIQDLEDELSIIKQEYMYILINIRKLQEVIKNKDNIITEFQKYGEMTKSKFKAFEDSNQLIKDDNENLKRFLAEYKERIEDLEGNEKAKDHRIAHLMSEKMNLENSLDERKLDLIHREDDLRVKYEDKEREVKGKYKEREENLKKDYISEISSINTTLELLRIENEKLKIEIKGLKRVVEDSESLIEEKEHEFIRVNEIKDLEYEKLQKTLKELLNDIQDFENKYNDKNTDIVAKFKRFEENESQLYDQLSGKQKRIKQLEDEMNGYKNYILDLQANLKEYEIIIENKEKLIDQLKTQLEEIVKELQKKEIELAHTDDLKHKEMNDICDRVNSLSDEKDAILKENDDLRKNLEHAAEKMKELTGLIDDKYKIIESNYQLEMNGKQKIENKFRAMIKQLQDNEDKMMKENSALKDLLSHKDMDIEKLRMGYENKVQKVSLFIIQA
jgi:chromosome segregation ATPase